MGLFDLFGPKVQRDQETLRKLGKRLTEKFGPPENRQKAIEQLSGLGSHDALKTLCLRFTSQSEPSITDQEEKEHVRELLVEVGRGAVAPVSDFVREQEKGIAWGLRVLAALVDEEELLATAVGELDRLGKTYSRDPEKKLTLLTWIEEHHAGANPPALVPALVALLEDFSDDVRIRAARALSGRPLTEAGREALIQLLLRDRENARVRGEVLAALHRLGADVKGHRPSVEALLVEPWFLDKDGLVKKRG